MSLLQCCTYACYHPLRTLFHSHSIEWHCAWLGSFDLSIIYCLYALLFAHLTISLFLDQLNVVGFFFSFFSTLTSCIKYIPTLFLLLLLLHHHHHGFDVAIRHRSLEFNVNLILGQQSWPLLRMHIRFGWHYSLCILILMAMMTMRRGKRICA